MFGKDFTRTRTLPQLLRIITRWLGECLRMPNAVFVPPAQHRIDDVRDHIVEEFGAHQEGGGDGSRSGPLPAEPQDRCNHCSRQSGRDAYEQAPRLGPAPAKSEHPLRPTAAFHLGSLNRPTSG